MNEKITAIIVAGGSGKRMGGKIKKQYIFLKGKEVLAHTIEAFENCEVVNNIIVVVAEDEIKKVQQNIVDKYKFEKVTNIVAGGKERQDSVYNGLQVVEDNTDFVIIHDGARPFIKKETIKRCLDKARQMGASIVAVPVKDTIKICNKQTQCIEETPERALLWSVQTPQIFSVSLLKDAYKYAREKNLQVTDDSMLVEAYGTEVYVTEGEYTNIKLTTPEDILIGEAFLKALHRIE